MHGTKCFSIPFQRRGALKSFTEALSFGTIFRGKSTSFSLFVLARVSESMNLTARIAKALEEF